MVLFTVGPRCNCAGARRSWPWRRISGQPGGRWQCSGRLAMSLLIGLCNQAGAVRRKAQSRPFPSAARPRAVSSTRHLCIGVPVSPRTSTRSSASASSQIVRRGHVERHASIVSAYVRGALQSHSSRSRVRERSSMDRVPCIVSITLSLAVCCPIRAINATTSFE
jgi:hypothetical protein